MSDYSYMYDEFPEVISGEQLRKIHHISKRKCAWLLQSGAIPCTDNYNKTRRYAVKLDDVIEYIIESENAAERVQPQRPPECFREQLSDEWFDVPDVFTITDVSDITGYTPNAVDNWILKGSLRSVIVQTGLITCHEWLIDFYCGDGYNIVKKVDKYLELLRKLI
ncbi:hypothetical protein [Ruminococcus sp.]|uniref:hypothetical protein n=1 Tax=Ruminococcus sp. TaxID=41978 RepID=UPI0025FD39CD|nr:hypothetical protein [Ruminococcus sp.]MBR1430249.1 hypothetical protein [Ruminococcus sp.]